MRRRISALRALWRRDAGAGRVAAATDRSEVEYEQKRRTAFFNAAKGETPYLAVQSGEEVFFVSTHDIGVGRIVFTHGHRSDMRMLARALDRLTGFGLDLPDEPMFVEVGANIGTTTVLALRRHGFSSAVSLEPSPENFRLLRINLVANGIEDRVRTIAAAASDSEGELLLDVTSGKRGSHRVVKGPVVKASKVTVPVEAITLDGLVSKGVIDLDRVGLLWIDAPKHEGKVLIGASRFLEAGVPIVTAIRVSGTRGDRRRPWDVPAETKSLVLEKLATHYTDAVLLRKKPPFDQATSTADLGTLVDSFKQIQDLLLVRR